MSRGIANSKELPGIGTWVFKPIPPTPRQYLRFHLERLFDPWKAMRRSFLLAVGLSLILSGSGYLFAIVSVIPFIAWMVFVALSLYALSIRKATAAEINLVEKEDRETTIVEILFSEDDHLFGSDRGVIWTDQEELHFSGNASSFSVPLSNFRPVTRGVTRLEASLILRMRSEKTQLTVLPVRTASDPVHHRTRAVLSLIEGAIDRKRKD